MKKTLVLLLNLLAAASLLSDDAGVCKFGKMKDTYPVVTNAYQAVSNSITPQSAWSSNLLSSAQFASGVYDAMPSPSTPWATNLVLSSTFKSGVTNAIHRKIAMFIIPVNADAAKFTAFRTNTEYVVGAKVLQEGSVYGCTNDVLASENTSWARVAGKFKFITIPTIYKGFELKGTTTNFGNTEGTEDGTTFYSQSELADESIAGNDKMKLYVESYHKSSDGRKYTRISDTLTGWDDDDVLVNVTVLVDVSCLIRTPETSNPEWLYENNENLFWCYVRTKNGGHEEEIISGSGTSYQCLWRPIMPVKWFSSMPNWANQ